MRWMAKEGCLLLPVRPVRGLVRKGAVPFFLAVLLSVLACTARASGDVELPATDALQPIVVSAAEANRWQQGQYEVWVLRGECRIRQGASEARSGEAVVWVDRAAPLTADRNKMIAYLEGDVEVALGGRESANTRLTDNKWFGRFETVSEVRVHAGRVEGRPVREPPIFHRGTQHRRPPPPPDAIRRTQFTEPAEAPAAPQSVLPSGTRRILVVPRSNVAAQVHWFRDPNSDDWIGLVNSGVNLIVYGVEDVGVIDVVADRLVIWTRGLEEPDLSGERAQSGDIPLEIYMEGNIVFRQGERRIYAERMYYDVANRVGTVLEAEVLTPVPEYQGLLRLKVEVLRQTGEGRFFAENGLLTSSRMGRPGYRIESQLLEFEDVQQPVIDPFTGRPVLDPKSGQPVLAHEQMATARNNFLFLGEVPVFYWPKLGTDLSNPTFYIRRLRVRNDSVYGFQILSNFSAYELLGVRHPPEGTDWDISLDWMSDRGLGHGTTFSYDNTPFPYSAGHAAGLADFWGIYDHGEDNLGEGRRRLEPEEDYRFRWFWQHRQEVFADYQLSAEFGWISDRNFMQQYFEEEWDTLKDMTTGVELKKAQGNMSWSVTGDIQLNPFFTETEWLPRGDHFWLGQELLGERLTWYEHTSVGYGRLWAANPPKNPADAPFDLMPWEVDAQGERLVTRHELDLPFQAGVVKVVPFALGELGHWGEDLSGDDLQRTYWQAGVRASMPMWRADPTVENSLFNLHGLAHKVVFDAEVAFADSNRELDRLPLYDPLDDNSIEAFRHRLAMLTYGMTDVPPQFDSRSYALRSGLGGWVTSPSMEIADDLTTVRLGVRQRWQTKRGMPGNRRIVDFITLDTGMTWFPDEDRDNFGTNVGLLNYDLRWHLGDRVTLVSDGIFDFFPDGQRVINVGGFLSRPPRGDLYVGMRLIEGPISHQILSASYSYRMSPKWISTLGTSIDLGGDGNIGQRLMLTRIGESLLVSAGLTVDSARDNVGVAFAIEPRFLPSNRLGRVGGAQIPPAGASGLE